VKQSFSVPPGTIDVVVHEASRIVSISRLDADGRTVSSTMCDWAADDLKNVLVSSMDVPYMAAGTIASKVREAYPGLALPASPPTPPAYQSPLPSRLAARRVPSAGIGRRFVAVLLDSLIVFLPLGILMGALPKAAPAAPQDGYATASAHVETDVQIIWLILALCYYVLAEGLTGRTLGKRIVGIRVVGEDGADITFGAALVRNLLRIVDGLLGYLVGVIFALTSPRRQRLGDRAAHTVVVRR
jgi:uncharacterized RDD family membrane protein YckC